MADSQNSSSDCGIEVTVTPQCSSDTIILEDGFLQTGASILFEI